MQRKPKDDYYLGIAREVADRGTCFRRKIGSLIVKNDQIISTGYVGAPRGVKDSFQHGFCLRDKQNIPHGHRYELCRSVHSEQNAIINAARAGVSLLCGDMFIWGEDPKTKEQIFAYPCFICKKMIINAGIERVVCSAAKEGKRIFNVNDWIEEWRRKDILDDQDQYGSKSTP